VTVEDVARTCLGQRLTADDVRRRAARPPLDAFVAVDGGGQMMTMRGREALVARRTEGIRLTAELLDRHRGVIGALATLPFIRMLALSGGTAHRNARGGDDIDLFVVAASGRIYSAYTMLFLASQLTRTRGVLCPNYLVDENHLEIAYNHDLFTAHQAISLVPIAGLDTFDRFSRANEEWVRVFYPGYQPRPAAASLGEPGVQARAERAIGLLGDRMERFLSLVWRLHLGRRVSRAKGSDVVLGGGILKLHLSDHRTRVLARFAERLEALRARWETDFAPPAAAAPARQSAPN